jgi:hypothetical protein
VVLILLSEVGFTRQTDSEDLVAKVAQRIAEFPEIKDYEAEVSSMLIRVDKHWKAKKTTLVEKIVRSRDGIREEEILSAIETEKGKNTDVTQEMRKETRKQEAKAKIERAKRAKKGEEDSEGGGHRQDLTIAQMLPFNEEKRQHFTFQEQENAVFAGKTVRVLESKSKVRSDKYFEGIYYIDPETYDVLRAFIHPAKNPGPIKRLEMEFLFQIEPGGQLIPKESRVRIHVGLVIKNIRMEVQEVYKSFKVLESEHRP